MIVLLDANVLIALAIEEHVPDDLPYRHVEMRGVVGHRQVTDAYLPALARARGARMATFDAGLGALHPDVVDQVPTT